MKPPTRGICSVSVVAFSLKKGIRLGGAVGVSVWYSMDKHLGMSTVWHKFRDYEWARL